MATASASWAQQLAQALPWLAVGFALREALAWLHRCTASHSRRLNTLEAAAQRLDLSRPRLGLEGLVGGTPLVEIASLSRLTGCRILAKLEANNPGGSPKDRVALHIALQAEREGKLQPGGTLVEGSAGSTGISLALLARARGYRCIVVMPDDMALEKEIILRTLGAQVHRVRAVAYVNRNHYCRVAQQMAQDIPGGFFVDQFENLENFEAHYRTTGPELWLQCGGRVDAFVMGAGTGGTIAGVGRFLHERNPAVRIALVDPPGSALHLKITSGVLYAPQQAEQRLQRNRYDTILEGVGLDRLTNNFSQALSYITDSMALTDQQAVDMARFLLQHDGLFVGSSTALNLVGAVRLARELGPGHTVTTCICDSGHRAMSKLFNDDFLARHNLLILQSYENLDFVD